jgi:hypothetical protein
MKREDDDKRKFWSRFSRPYIHFLISRSHDNQLSACSYLERVSLIDLRPSWHLLKCLAIPHAAEALISDMMQLSLALKMASSVVEVGSHKAEISERLIGPPPTPGD